MIFKEYILEHIQTVTGSLRYEAVKQRRFKFIYLYICFPSLYFIRQSWVNKRNSIDVRSCHSFTLIEKQNAAALLRWFTASYMYYIWSKKSPRQEKTENEVQSLKTWNLTGLIRLICPTLLPIWHYGKLKRALLWFYKMYLDHRKMARFQINFILSLMT